MEAETLDVLVAVFIRDKIPSVVSVNGKSYNLNENYFEIKMSTFLLQSDL
jgi:hypothetical protein